MSSTSFAQVALNQKYELLKDVVYPGALESKTQFTEDITEMREQIRKQASRLQELRLKRIEEPGKCIYLVPSWWRFSCCLISSDVWLTPVYIVLDAFFGTEDPALANVDVMTDVSMAPTAFTRYTVAPSTVSRTSKRSSRSKRKLERKAGSGRKGTVDEEEYLLKSVGKLVDRFKNIRGIFRFPYLACRRETLMVSLDEVQKLLPHLLQFSPEHREEGRELQRDYQSLEEELGDRVTEIWKKPPQESEGVETEDTATLANIWTRKTEEPEKNRVSAFERVPKPEMGKHEWKMRLYDH